MVRAKFEQVNKYRFIYTIILLITVSGCTVTLVSNYDEKTDTAITTLHKNTEIFFVTVKSQVGLPECEYDNHEKFYRDTEVAMRMIELRAKALQKNELTTEQVSLLHNSFNQLQSLHKGDCLSEGQIENLRRAFNSSFTGILKLELAKKRGK